MIVFTGGGFDAGKISPFLFRSLAPSNSLPENPDSVNELKRQLRVASQEPDGPRPQATILPAMAHYTSDRNYFFPANELQLRSIRLHFASPSKADAKIDLAGQLYKVAVGLDDRLRFSPGQYGLPLAAKGRWLTSDTFSLDLDTIANINHFNFELKFVGDRVLVRLDEVTGEVQGFRVSGRSS